MGWLEDMKAEIGGAQSSRDAITPVPATRLDTLVADPASGKHPQSAGALQVFKAITAFATLPLGVSYRVTVVCAPEAVR